MIVTTHAVKRIRERLGINKSGAQREAERAHSGLPRSKCSGRLRRHLDRLLHLHGHNKSYRVTPAAIYAFDDDVLITVIPMPKAHAKSALSQYKRHKESLVAQSDRAPSSEDGGCEFKSRPEDQLPR